MGNFKKDVPKQIRVGALQKKLLLLLAGGFSLALSGTPVGYFKVLSQMSKEWNKINDNSMRKAIRSLYKSKLIKFKENPDGRIELILDEDGEHRALSYKLEEMKITKPKQWDGKWRVIIFDIPEHLKKAREALRGHLRQLQFYQLQKSVFVIPYECGDEIEFLIEIYDVRQYVRQLIATGLDNELHLKKIFEI
jgi:DNA-binding transcriptional regulator PaaX